MQSALNTLEGEGYLEQQFVRLGNTYDPLFKEKIFSCVHCPHRYFPHGKFRSLFLEESQLRQSMILKTFFFNLFFSFFCLRGKGPFTCVFKILSQIITDGCNSKVMHYSSQTAMKPIKERKSNEHVIP